jgi:hypothetical protein
MTVGNNLTDRSKLATKRCRENKLLIAYRFRKLFTRYEKKIENYLGLVQLSCSIIINRKTILGAALS